MAEARGLWQSSNNARPARPGRRDSYLDHEDVEGMRCSAERSGRSLG